MGRTLPKQSLAALAIWALVLPGFALSTPVPVRHTQGMLRGFLVLSTTGGVPLAEGDLSQVAVGDRVTTHLVFRFKDGSLHDETVVFTQRDSFQVQTYHLVQKGRSFNPPIDLSFDRSSGAVTVHYRERDGKEKSIADRMEIPPDVSNGLLLTMLENIQPTVPQTTVSMLATSPKPSLVQLAITPQGQDPFSVAGVKHTATHYVVKVQIGGVKGAVAKVLDKQPPDIHVWVLGGDAPVFVKMEGPLFYGGPIWRIELTSPVWPHTVVSRVKD